MWLLVGGDSEIGRATAERARAAGITVAATTRRRDHVGADRPYLDLAAPLDDWQPPPGTEAACIFAGVPRIAACEADPAGSAFINVDQTIALVDRLLAVGAYVLFLSTNQVFDGTKPRVCAEAPASPVSEYGRQKARTEVVLKERMNAGAALAILRLAKVVSPDMALLHQWIDQLSGGAPIRAFGDMMIAPTPIDLVCKAAIALMKDRAHGLFQLTGPRDVTYVDVARHLARKLGVPQTLVQSESALAAGQPPGAIPAHTTLDSTALNERYGFAVPDVYDVIDAVIAARRSP